MLLRTALALLLFAGALNAQSMVLDATTSPQPKLSFPREFTTIGSTTYFVADTPEFGTEIWKTDGTTGGTSIVKDVDPGPQNENNIHIVGSIGSVLYFTASFSGAIGTLWQTDGTSAGTTMVTSFDGFHVATQRVSTTGKP